MTDTVSSALPTFPQIPAGSGAPILWFFFVLVLLMTAYYVFAELYHWFRYGYMYPLVWIALPVYLIGTVALMGAMLAGIAAL